MPFYKLSEMQAKKSSVGVAMGKSVAGELLKVGITTYQEGEGPPPHFHPNEEQFILMLEGKMRMVCGDEERIVEHGDLIHIPRNTRHAGRRCSLHARVPPAMAIWGRITTRLRMLRRFGRSCRLRRERWASQKKANAASNSTRNPKV
jgi:uncharacterized RmlC-like cupin family protein